MCQGPSDSRDRSGSTGSHRSTGSTSRSQGGGSRGPSTHAPGSQPGGSTIGGSSRPSSTAGDVQSSGPAAGWKAGTGIDPARDDPVLTPEQERLLRISKRVDLPAEAFVESGARHPFALRPGLGQSGKPLNVRVNQFRVCGLPNFDVFQYDVSLSTSDSTALSTSFDSDIL